ncbi:MAG: hypothetical protein RIR49_921 [Actinomycetota bacterium]
MIELVRHDIENLLDGRLPDAIAAISRDVVTPGRLRRVLVEAGVLVVDESSTVVRPEFERVVIADDRSYVAHFTSWTYHGRL